MDVCVVKVGGKVAANENVLLELAKEFKKIEGLQFVFVHGGGAEVTNTAKIFGIKSQFVDGVRHTSKEEMDVVDGVLSGKINKQIVRLFHKANLKAVGLSGSDGSLFTGNSIQTGSHTGKVTSVDINLLKILLKEDYIPVVSTTSMDKNFSPLNINADEAALAIAKQIRAKALIFISDIPGVLKENQVIKNLNQEKIEQEIKNNVISGGMIPKVNSSLTAIQNGVEKVVIGDYQTIGDLEKLLTTQKGTSITK